ncbi:MAG: amidohydrolase family protein [Armatimonadota bacterium]
MTILDAYCGIGPWSTRDKLLPYRPEEILTLMDHFGIEKALIYSNAAVSWGQPPGVNDFVIEAARVSDRFIPALALAPNVHTGYPTPNDYLAVMRSIHARAAWLFVQGTVRGLWHWHVGELLDMLVEHNIPLFLLADQCPPDALDAMMHDAPELKVVLCGVGYMGDSWLYPLLQRHPGLYVCLGNFFVPPGDPERFVHHFGAGRLLFGSGLPHFSPGGLIGHVTYAGISSDAKEAIFSGNLQRLLEEVAL